MTLLIALGGVLVLATVAVFAGWLIGEGIACKVERHMTKRWRDMNDELKGAAHV